MIDREAERMIVTASTVFWISAALLAFVLWGLVESWDVIQALKDCNVEY